jgi:ParB family chromosome partitioning protein
LERVTQRMMEGRKPISVDEVDLDPNVKAAIREMERALGTKVRIIEGAKGKGKIEIEYYSAEDLDRIYGAIAGQP